MKSEKIQEFKETDIGKIPADWEINSLGNFISVLGDYHSNGSYKKLKDNVTLFSEENYALMIRTTNFERDDFSDNLRFVDKHAYDFLAKSKVHPFDIIMNKIANAGSVYLMPKLEKPVSLGMNQFLLRIKDLDQKFVYYFLKYIEDYVNSFAQGSVTLTITKDIVRKLLIAFPKSIDEQKLIVKILFDLESNIKLIQQINKILEQLTRAIFKSWFVDFDGQTEFVDSELGQIPKGWNVSTFSDHLKIIKGKKPNDVTTIKHEGYLPQILIDALDNGNYNYANPNNMITCNEKDIIMVMDGSSSGRVAIGHKGVVGSTLAKITLTKSIFVYYLFFLLKYLKKDIQSNVTGSAIPHTDKNFILESKIIIPNKKNMGEFEDLMVSIFSKINHNKHQIKSLKEIYINLLPKLMSGEIRLN